MKTALSIAGSDSCGGAGIQADLKTMLANGVYGMTAITALTAQNTQGVRAVVMVEPQFLAQQIDAVFEDIRPNAVKIGMIPSVDLAQIVCERLTFYHVSNLVIDPVMVATSGSVLTRSDAIHVMGDQLFGKAKVLTPNIPESEMLLGKKIYDSYHMEQVAKELSDRYGCAVLCKGGHQVSDADDVLCENGSITWFRGQRIANRNTHGTGCTLSSAIAANLAKGFELEESIDRAKAYISGALADMMDLGKGSGPLNHSFDLKSLFVKEAE